MGRTCHFSIRIRAWLATVTQQRGTRGELWATAERKESPDQHPSATELQPCQLHHCICRSNKRVPKQQQTAYRVCLDQVFGFCLHYNRVTTGHKICQFDRCMYVCVHVRVGRASSRLPRAPPSWSHWDMPAGWWTQCWSSESPGRNH